RPQRQQRRAGPGRVRSGKEDLTHGRGVLRHGRWRIAMAGKVNRIGLEPIVYKGGKTTLCAGCGHNAISERIIDAFYEMGVDPSQVIKLSGIGCQSKSPADLLCTSHGFNAVHGRMPSVGTGAMLANKKLIAIGVSGDGDTGAI